MKKQMTKITILLFLIIPFNSFSQLHYQDTIKDISVYSEQIEKAYKLLYFFQNKSVKQIEKIYSIPGFYCKKCMKDDIKTAYKLIKKYGIPEKNKVILTTSAIKVIDFGEFGIDSVNNNITIEFSFYDGKKEIISKEEELHIGYIFVGFSEDNTNIGFVQIMDDRKKTELLSFP